MNLLTVIFRGIITPITVIPAQAGIQLAASSILTKLDSRLRGNDGFSVEIFA
jgi:hypothetical protein